MTKQGDMLTALSMGITFGETIGRVKNLVTLYASITGPGRGRRPVNSSDVLRAAVVFLHATFEQALRELARRKLPQASSNALDTVPLKNLSRSGRAEKFFLGALLPFKGQSVDDVIRDSVEEYLSHFTINTTGDIVSLLRTFDIPTKSIAEEPSFGKRN